MAHRDPAAAPPTPATRASEATRRRLRAYAERLNRHLERAGDAPYPVDDGLEEIARFALESALDDDEERHGLRSDLAGNLHRLEDRGLNDAIAQLQPHFAQAAHDAHDLWKGTPDVAVDAEAAVRDVEELLHAGEPLGPLAGVPLARAAGLLFAAARMQGAEPSQPRFQPAIDHLYEPTLPSAQAASLLEGFQFLGFNVGACSIAFLEFKRVAVAHMLPVDLATSTRQVTRILEDVETTAKDLTLGEITGFQERPRSAISLLASAHASATEARPRTATARALLYDDDVHVRAAAAYMLNAHAAHDVDAHRDPSDLPLLSLSDAVVRAAAAHAWYPHRGRPTVDDLHLRMLRGVAGAMQHVHAGSASLLLGDDLTSALAAALLLLVDTGR